MAAELTAAPGAVPPVEATPRLPPAFWWIWVSTLFHWIGRFVVPFASLYLTQTKGLSPATAGAIVALYGAGGIVSVITGGLLADRWSARDTVVTSGLATACITAALAFVGTPQLFGALMFLLGIVSHASHPARNTLIVRVVPVTRRSHAFDLNYWAMNVGYAIGPVIAGWMMTRSAFALFVVDAVVVAATTVVVWVKVPKDVVIYDDADAALGRGFRPVLRDRVFLVFTGLSFLFALVYMQSTSSLPMAMASHGLDGRAYGSVLSLNGLLLIVCQLPAARVVRRFRRSYVLALGMVLTGLGFGAGALAEGAPGFAVAAVVWTAGEMLVIPVGAYVVAQLAGPSMQGRYQGAHTLAWSIAAFLAPVVGGTVLQTWGDDELWSACLLVSVAAAVVLVMTAKGREARLAAAVEPVAVSQKIE